jgi:hypothetical protein
MAHKTLSNESQDVSAELIASILGPSLYVTSCFQTVCRPCMIITVPAADLDTVYYRGAGLRSA